MHYRPRSKPDSPASSPRSRCCWRKSSPARLCACSSTTPSGVTLGAVRAGHGPPERLPRALLARGVLARAGPAADQAPALQPLSGPPRPRAAARLTRRSAASAGTGSVTGRARRRLGPGRHDRRRRRRRHDPLRADRPLQPRTRRLSHVQGDRGGRTGPRGREEHLAREADGGARGRAAVGLQEDARLGALRQGRDGPRQRRLHRLGAEDPAGARGAAARRGDRPISSRPSTPRRARCARRPSPRSTSRSSRSTRTRSRSRTSPRTTSAGSPPRPPSR